MINISFAITVCNEAAELKRLLNQLSPCVIEGDEIVIQVDTENTTQSVLDIISDYEGVKDPVINSSNIIIAPCTKVFFNLNKDFANFKNHLLKKCGKEYIFQIDADEEVTQDQIHLIREILEMNPTIDCFLVPRINTVVGLTQEHIGKWGWRVDEHNRINWPDYQYRLWKNKPEIKWVGKVHERLEGYNQLVNLPDVDILALGHHKTIQKQEKQNNFYNNINITKELVVSLFDKSLDWLENINSDVKISVYRKGELSSYPNEIIVEPNLGRDVHTFFYHIVKNYDNLSDYTFFSQDYPFDHIENYINIINGDEKIWDTNTSQYFQDYRGYHWNSIGTMWTLYPSEQFNGHVLKANPDGSPHHHHYLPIVEIWNELFDDKHPNVFEFTPGGHFSISKEQVHTRSLEFYKKIILLLETQEFAPWVIERLEPYIFNPQIKTKL